MLPQLKTGDQDNPRDRMVRRLQGLLTALGSAVTIDGIFGPNTEAAVKHQQNAFGLAQSGVVDDNTWIVLIGSAEVDPASPPAVGMPAPRWQ
ncbi:MAG: peptidoglycan-binding protein [Nocardiopsaceae bacterium]|nr:peptidoglycan-binding protein [Nocardiopsaceae bacterium]